MKFPCSDLVYIWLGHCFCQPGTTGLERHILSIHEESLGTPLSEPITSELNSDSAQSPLTGGVLANMLLGEDEFTEPMTLLTDLNPSQAVGRPSDNIESIAQIVAHMQFWQDYSLCVIRGEKPRYPSNQAEKDATWREVEEGDWNGLASDFLAGLDSFMALTESDSEISRPLKDDETVGDRIRWTAMHNAYHCGQIVLLRRMLGAWPPAGEEG
jgi:hypothetical protein